MPDEDHDEALRRALGRVITMRRAELGLKRNDLRDRSGLSYPYVAELENGTKRPSSAALDALAQALELRPSELLERAEALVGGEDLMRSAPREATSSWFHAAASAPAAAERTASTVPPIPRLLRSRDSIDPLMRTAIEQIVREVVRDELERAGLIERPTRRRAKRGADLDADERSER